MNQPAQKAKPGRPVFQIDQDVLRRLREEKAYTQEQLAKELATEEGRACEVDTATSAYRRIERTGKTSLKKAALLAKILGVTLSCLQGKAPPEQEDYLAKLKAHIEARLEEGCGEKLQAQFKQELLINKNRDQCIENITKKIAYEIEAAQLTRNKQAIIDLIELTGLHEDELMKPANAAGYWMITGSMMDWTKTDLHRGLVTNEVLSEIMNRDRLEAFMHSDSAIRLSKDDRWFRMEVLNSKLSSPTRIEIARGHPDKNGLQWIIPSVQEEWHLCYLLESWAHNIANQVIDFDGKKSPSCFDNLRILVEKLPPGDGPQEKMIIENMLKKDYERNGEQKYYAKLTNYWHDEHEAFHFQLQCLLKAFLNAIKPHISSCHENAWQFEDNAMGITIKGKRNPADWHERKPDYYLYLVEETSGGGIEYAPWSQKSRNSALEYIKKAVATGDYPHDYSFPAPEFSRSA